VGVVQEDYNPGMRRRLTKTDPEFLRAISDALVEYKRSKGQNYTNASLASDLGVEESTVAKYIRKRAPIMAEALARACVDLGISFSYKNAVISASLFQPPNAGLSLSTRQMELLVEAEYAAESSSWRMTQHKAEPMEFTLRIKIAS
jgi:transcriptional regulator with XRE-family HTH domain